MGDGIMGGIKISTEKMKIIIRHQIFWKFKIGWFMGCNATFNKISVISSRSVLFEEETGVP